MPARPRPAESRNEAAARAIVARHLGAAVDRYDDGSQSRMPDGIIRYPDGRSAGLEIIGDHSDEFEQQWNALAKAGSSIVIDGLAWNWSVSLEHSANVKRVRDALPNVLRRVERVANGDRRVAENLVQQSLDFERLGLFSAHAYDDGHAGRVSLMSAPFTGFSQHANYLVQWVEEVLYRQADVAEKLALAQIGDERHAFIWVTIGSHTSINSFLDGSMVELPTQPPNLPSGVTHVWVASGFSSARSLAWFPDVGWHQLDTSWLHAPSADS